MATVMTMNLYQASNQWATRPPDERFGSLSEMLAACKGYADIAKEYESYPSDMKADVVDGEPVLVGQSGRPARLTHWAMGQLCSRAGAPAEYLRTLPGEMAAPLLNYGLMTRVVEGENRPVKLLMQSNGELLLRAVTGMGYQRFWNWRVAEGLMALGEHGWQVPPARPAMEGQPGTRVATEADVLANRSSGLSIQVGDLIAPAGLYASDHDMFAFMVNEDYRISVPGSPTGMARGFFVEHSEVGDSAYRVWLFLYEFVCGNHIVWNASNVKEISIRHTGNALDRIADSLRVELREYANSSAALEEEKLARLSTFELGGSREDVADLLFGKRLLSRTLALKAYDACEAEQTPVDGSNPRTPWGIAQGLTRVSQGAQYADQRNVLDRAAGKILEVF
jgi:hypothetical protein